MRAAGRQLLLKLCQYMRPKCHALLLDCSLNSPDTARLNIYQVRSRSTWWMLQ